MSESSSRSRREEENEPRQTFRRRDRLRTNLEFKRVFNARRRAGDAVLLIYVADNSAGHARLGLTVSRKVGNAVKRTRWKRLIREAFRRNRRAIPDHLDVVVIPRVGIEPTLDEVQDSLIGLTGKLARRARRLKSKRKAPKPRP